MKSSNKYASIIHHVKTHKLNFCRDTLQWLRATSSKSLFFAHIQHEYFPLHYLFRFYMLIELRRIGCTFSIESLILTLDMPNDSRVYAKHRIVLVLVITTSIIAFKNNQVFLVHYTTTERILLFLALHFFLSFIKTKQPFPHHIGI